MTVSAEVQQKQLVSHSCQESRTACINDQPDGLGADEVDGAGDGAGDGDAAGETATFGTEGGARDEGGAVEDMLDDAGTPAPAAFASQVAACFFSRAE